MLTASTQLAGKSFEVNGPGTINERGSEGTARVQAAGKTIDEVISKPYLYISVPSGSGTSVTRGKPWVRADLSTFSQSFGSSSVGAGSSNPSEVLGYLRAAGTVTRVGDEQVRGVSSTHYHALIELARFGSAVPAGERAAARKEGKLLERVTGAKTLPMDVWIGSPFDVRDDLVGRVLALSVVDHHVDAARAQSPRDRAPDAPGRSRDDRDLPLTHGSPLALAAEHVQLAPPRVDVAAPAGQQRGEIVEVAVHAGGQPRRACLPPGQPVGVGAAG